MILRFFRVLLRLAEILLSFVDILLSSKIVGGRAWAHRRAKGARGARQSSGRGGRAKRGGEFVGALLQRERGERERQQ